MIILKVELPPLSINKAWQGRRYKTKLYDDWLKEGLIVLPKQKMITTKCEVCLTFYMKNDKKADIDNPIKTCLDLLVKKKYIKDDVLIYDLHVYKIKSEEEGIEIEIYELT